MDGSVIITPLGDIPKKNEEFWYIASPYGHMDQNVIEQRMTTYEKVDAMLSYLGHLTFSPLDKHYKLKHLENLPGTYRYWARYCENMLKLACGIIVITQHGWTTAPGVQDEIRIAKSLNLPIYYV